MFDEPPHEPEEDAAHAALFLSDTRAGRGEQTLPPRKADAVADICYTRVSRATLCAAFMTSDVGTPTSPHSFAATSSQKSSFVNLLFAAESGSVIDGRCTLSPTQLRAHARVTEATLSLLKNNPHSSRRRRPAPLRRSFLASS
jgi:hypothetical protein